MHCWLWCLWRHFLGREKQIIGHFSGFFMEISTFWSVNGPVLHSGQLRDKKSLNLHEPSKWAIICMFCPHKKNNVLHFHNHRCINSYYPVVKLSVNYPQQGSWHILSKTPWTSEKIHWLSLKIFLKFYGEFHS